MEQHPDFALEYKRFHRELDKLRNTIRQTRNKRPVDTSSVREAFGFGRKLQMSPNIVEVDESLDKLKLENDRMVAKMFADFDEWDLKRTKK
jgi:hypothetical protein